MTKVTGVIQARLTSIRLARKALLPLAGRPVMHHLFDRAMRIQGVDDLVLEIPTGEANDPLEEATAAYPHIKVVRGPDDDLVTRFLMAADLTGADIIVRMWGDCPVTDPDLATALLQVAFTTGAAWAHYPNDSGYPEGLESHVLRVDALRALAAESDDMYERENIIPFFLRQPERFPILELRRQPNRNHLKCLLDTGHDYNRITRIFDILYPDHPDFGLADLEALAEQQPELFDPTHRITARSNG